MKYLIDIGNYKMDVIMNTADCNSNKFGGSFISRSIHFMLLLLMASSPAACGGDDGYSPDDEDDNTGIADIGEVCDRSSD